MIAEVISTLDCRKRPAPGRRSCVTVVVPCLSTSLHENKSKLTNPLSKGSMLKSADNQRATMADLVLDFFDVRANGHYAKRLILLGLEQLAAKMHRDNSEVRPDNGEHSLHGDAGAVPKGSDSVLLEARQHMQWARELLRKSLLRRKVGLCRTLVQLADDVLYWISHFGQHENVHVSKAAQGP